MDRNGPVRNLPEPPAASVGWRGPGWYWVDPEYLAGRHDQPAFTGPYSTEEAAKREYYAYCEIVTT